MKQNIAIIILSALLVMALGACGNGNKQSGEKSTPSLTKKTNKEKAEEFINSLDSTTKVLLVLPPSDSTGVFYVQNNTIKRHSVKTGKTSDTPMSKELNRKSEGQPVYKHIIGFYAGTKNITAIAVDDMGY